MGLNDVMKYFFITLAVSLISVTSSAMNVEINGKLTSTTIGDYSFEGVLDHKEEVVYEQYDANVPVEQIIDKDVKQKNLNAVAGKNIEGYSKLILKKIDEKTVFIEGDRR